MKKCQCMLAVVFGSLAPESILDTGSVSITVMTQDRCSSTMIRQRRTDRTMKSHRESSSMKRPRRTGRSSIYRGTNVPLKPPSNSVWTNVVSNVVRVRWGPDDWRTYIIFISTSTYTVQTISILSII